MIWSSTDAGNLQGSVNLNWKRMNRKKSVGMLSKYILKAIWMLIERSQNIIESTGWRQKSNRTVRLFNKLLLNLKVLFYKRKYVGPENTKLTSQSRWTLPSVVICNKRCLQQSQRSCKCLLCSFGYY